MGSKNFRFYTNGVSITKAKDAKGNEVMRLGGIASTQDQDADGEFLDPTGFDVTYLQNEGIVNWHHGAKTNPEAIIGEPSKVEINNKGMYVEVDLYPHSAMARSVYKLAQVLEKNSTTRRLGFSIEGKAIERDPTNKAHIKKAAITGIAVTHMPKNPNTLAQIIKGMGVEDEEVSIESIDTIKKALQEELTKAKVALANHIINNDTDDEDEDELMKKKSLSTDSSSGKALTKESLDKDCKTVTKGHIFNRIFKAFPDITISKAKRIEYLIQQQTKMKGNTAPTDADITKALSTLGVADETTTLEKCIELGHDLIEKGKTLDQVEKALLRRGAQEDTISKALEAIKKAEDDMEEEDDEDEEEPIADKGKMKKGLKKGLKKGDDEEEAGGDTGDDEDMEDKGDDEEEETPAEVEEEMEEKGKMKKGLKKAGKTNGSTHFFKAGNNTYHKILTKGDEAERADDEEYEKTEKGFSVKKKASIMKGGTKKSDDVILKALRDLGAKQDTISKAMGTVLQQTLLDNSALQGQVEQLTMAVEELQKGGVGRKSVATARAVDRSFGGGDDITKGGDVDGKTLSISKQRGAVLQLLEKAAFAPIEKGESQPDGEFAKAMTDFEINRTITSKNVFGRLQKEHGITLTA